MDVSNALTCLVLRLLICEYDMTASCAERMPDTALVAIELTLVPKLTTEAVDKAATCAELNSAKACVLMDTRLEPAIALTCAVVNAET